MAVQPMAMEIKEALMVSLVPAYLVKGPVVEHWVKHRIAGLEHGHFLGFCVMKRHSPHDMTRLSRRG